MFREKVDKERKTYMEASKGAAGSWKSAMPVPALTGVAAMRPCTTTSESLALAHPDVWDGLVSFIFIGKGA